MNRKTNVYKLNFLLLCIFIGMSLFLGLMLLSGKAAAGTAEAYVIRYSSQTGSGFQVKNSSGRSVTVRKDMRLYSGYVLQTAADNYVYLSLDSSKAIKLDQNTKVEIQKEGTKNVIKVHAGKIFFHASEKLKKDESFHVSTSTMSMGIRGTSGCIFADSRYEGGKPVGTVEGMHIYNGLGEVRRNIDSGNKKEISIFLEPGYKAEAEISHMAGGNVSFSDSAKKIPFEEIPSMVFEEMKRDTALYKKILEEMPQMKGVSMENLQKFLETAKAREEKIQAEKDAYVKKVLEEVQKQYRLSLIDDLEDGSVVEKDTGSGEDTKNQVEGRPEDKTQTESDTGDGQGSSSTGGSSGSSGGSQGSGSSPGQEGRPLPGFAVRQPYAALSKEAHSITEISALDMELGLSEEGYEPYIFWCNLIGEPLQTPEGIMVDEINNERVSFKITPYCVGHFYFRIKIGERYSQLCSIKVESGFEREILTSDRMEGTLYLLGTQGDNWVALPDADFTEDSIVWFSESSGWKVRTEKPTGFSMIFTEPGSDNVKLKFELNTAEKIEEGTYYFRMKNKNACTAVYTLNIALAKEKPLYELDNEREAELQVKGEKFPASIPVKGDILYDLIIQEKGLDGHITDSDFTWTINNQDNSIEIMPKSGTNPKEGSHTIYLTARKASEDIYVALMFEPITIDYVPSM